LTSCRSTKTKLREGYYLNKKMLNQLILLIKQEERIEKEATLLVQIEVYVTSISDTMLKSLLALELEVEVVDLLEQVQLGTLEIDLLVVQVRTWLGQFLRQLKDSYETVFGKDIDKLSRFIDDYMADSNSGDVRDAAKYVQNENYLKDRRRFYGDYRLKLDKLETLMLE
jgi:hypothetical protein